MRQGVPASSVAREQMVALYLSGASLREAGAALGWSWTAARTALRLAGISPRPNHIRQIAQEVHAKQAEDPTTKVCSYCEHRKSATDENFYRHPNGQFRSRCKACHQLLAGLRPRSDQMRKRHRVEEMNRRLRVKYGLSQDEYQKLVDESGGCCRICGKPEGQARRARLSLDHCHKTNKARGMLCSSCNMLLGLANDDPNVLKRAAEYLLNTSIQSAVHVVEVQVHDAHS